MNARELTAVAEPELRELLTSCCGSPHWVGSVMATRPWSDADALLHAAEARWQGLSRDELSLAVAHHPRLGESRAAAALSARSSAWSAGEQAGVRTADDVTRAALADANAAYEARFGHTFILCASGRSAAEMLDAIRARMSNDAETELTVTADELWKITRLRLEKLLASA